MAAASPAATKAGKAGKITIYPGLDRPSGIATGPDGALWFTNQDSNTIGRITTTGVVKFFFSASINFPSEIVAGPDGAMWFTNTANSPIGRITTAGVITNYTDSSMNLSGGIVVGPDGALWFTNGSNNTIGRITPLTAAPSQGRSFKALWPCRPPDARMP